MKAQKIIIVISIILLVIIITAASFFGIYSKKEYKVANLVPNYKLGMEFTNSRTANLEVDKSIESETIYDSEGNVVEKKEEGKEYTEENGYTIKENKKNPDEILTQDNFTKTKNIILKRLHDLGVEQYIIKQDKNNGNIQIEMTDNENTDDVIGTIAQKGIFQITDEETGEVLLDNNNIKKVELGYGQTTSAVNVYLQIYFDKQGQAKLEEISKIYIETTKETTDENGETKEEKVTKNVNVMLDGETYRTTYFGDTITDGILSMQIGSSENPKVVQQYALEAARLAVIINTGILPISYNNSTYQVSGTITDNILKIGLYILIGILAIMLIVAIIKFKIRGIMVSLLQIGFIGLLLLTLRYVKIQITIEGILGIITSVILNYIYIYRAFKNSKEEFIKGTTSKFALDMIPIYILAVVFTFNQMSNLSSLGMTLVWGTIVMYLYNLTITQITVKTIETK